MAIVLPILSTFSAAGVRAAQNSLMGLNGTMGSVGKMAAKAGVAMVGFQAAISSVAFAVNSVTAARDLERNMNALGMVFDSLTPKMTEFVDSAVSIGLSTSDAAKASTFLGSVLRSAGFSMEETATQTQRLVGLASDLATVYGYDVQEALTGMTALFRGEYDPIEKFGVAMKQSEVNAVLAAKGLGKLTGQALLNAQQQVRLELLYQRTTIAQGAFAKQSGTLFVEQKKLEASFTNMQATIGQALIPSLVRLMQSFAPILEKAAPVLTRVFESIADTIDALAPTVLALVEAMLPVADIFGVITGVVAEVLAQALYPVTEILKVLTPILYVVADVVRLVAGVFELILVPVLGVVTTILGGMIRVLGNLLDGLKTLLNPVGAFFGGVMDWLGSVNPAMKQFFADIRNGAKEAADGLTTTSIRVAENASFAKGKTETKTPTTAGTDYVKQFFSDMADEIKKQSARVKLEMMGASTGLIDSILSNSDWSRLYAKIVAGGVAGIKALQNQFNRTKSGMDEIAKVAEEAAQAAEEYAKALQEVADSVNAFSIEIADLLVAVAPMPRATAELGQFENAVVSAFDAIRGKLAEAVDNKLLFQSSADDLAAYASATESTLRGLANQRDAIAKRIADANDLIANTRTAVFGFGNITSLLEQQSDTIVRTTQSVVDGIRLTLTETLNTSSLTGDLTKKFKDVLDKTKKFALDLKELRRLGLNQNLFKQIVDAGLESGGATAAAIIAGGGSTIQELNGLFLDLQTTGEEIAQQTAEVMYGAGVDLTDGLINGLLAQENALKEAAQTLADAFTSTFNTRMSDLIKTDAYMLAGLSPNMGGVDQSIGGGVGMRGGVAFTAQSSSPAKIFEVNINAGMVTDKAELGQAIVDSITRYERTNGNVWQRV